MNARSKYEAHRQQALEAAIEIRRRLVVTYEDYAKQALARKDYEAANAFETAASLALGTCTAVINSVSSSDDEP